MLIDYRLLDMAKTRQNAKAAKATAKKSSKAGTAKAVNGKLAKAKRRSPVESQWQTPCKVDLEQWKWQLQLQILRM